jgi:hypothetical protein
MDLWWWSEREDDGQLRTLSSISMVKSTYLSEYTTWNSAFAFPILSRSNESTTYICMGKYINYSIKPENKVQITVLLQTLQLQDKSDNLHRFTVEVWGSMQRENWALKRNKELQEA